ncbi:MAG: hypothetical protein ABIG55_06780 [Candidatus Omnitrophota bacterium]|nr:hypothetical protein [Candidatus Omnitrophota bacterium]
MRKKRAVLVFAFLFILAVFPDLAMGEGEPAAPAEISKETPAPPSDYIDTCVHLDGEYISRDASAEDTDTGKRKKKMTVKEREPGKKDISVRNLIKDYDAAAKGLLEDMDRFYIRKAVVMPPPHVPKQVLRRDYKDIQKTIENYPDSFALGAGGYTLNPLIHASDPENIGKSLEFRFTSAAERLVHEGAKCFGEMSALSLSFDPQDPFSEAAADHPLFLELADIAAKYDIPVSIQMEAVSADMPLPTDLKELSSGNPDILTENISALERLLVHNRGANIIWNQAGYDNTGHLTPSLVRKLLNKHKNLYVGIRIGGAGLVPAPKFNRITDDKGEVREEWLALFRDFPERFLIASGGFAGIKGKTPTSSAVFENTWSLLGKLPYDVADRIGKENAKRLLHIK